MHWSGGSVRWIANVSLMFSDLALPDRLSRVRDAGIDAVEMWWPFSSPRPGGREVDLLVTTLDQAGVSLVAMNFYGGNQLLGDRGVLVVPECHESILASAEVAADVASRTGCALFNLPVGDRSSSRLAPGSEGLACLAEVCDRMAEIGTVLVEPLTYREGDQALRSPRDATALLERLRHGFGTENCGYLLDVYHLVNNGDDPAQAARQHAAHLRHVQIADVPGRGAPGTGEIDFSDFFAALDDIGYRGLVSCEYQTSGTVSDFAWLRPARRGDGMT